MVELGRLEKTKAEFDKRGVQIFAVSTDDVPKTKEMQDRFPSIRMISDAGGSMLRALDLVHAGEKSPNGGEIYMPTTVLVGGDGKVLWTYRPPSVVVRVEPETMLAEIDRR